MTLVPCSRMWSKWVEGAKAVVGRELKGKVVVVGKVVTVLSASAPYTLEGCTV
jgi:hypothetical protein